MTTWDRFWEKVVFTDTCWVWAASVGSHGYGQVGEDGRVLLAHRLSYEWLVGPIPQGYQVDHLCRVRPCVRPEHLEAVSQVENLRRQGASQTNCVRGHEFTPTTTYISPRGHRRCRICARLRRGKVAA